VIQNKTGDGIFFSNVVNINLGYVNVLNGSDDGIDGTQVNGFAINRSNITNNGDAANEEGIAFVNLSGVVTFINTSMTQSGYNNLRIENTSGTISSFTVTGSSISNNKPVTGNSGALINIAGTSQITTASITSTTFNGNLAAGIQTVTADTATISDFTISGCTVTNNGLGIDFSKSQQSSQNFKILNNTTFTGQNSHAINLFTTVGAGTTGVFNGRIENNTIGNAGVAGSGSAIGNGIRVNINGDADAAIVLNNNNIRQTPNGRGIEVIGRNGTGGLDVTITNNNVNPQDTSGFPLAAILVQSNCATICNTVRSDVRGNTVPAGSTFDLLPTYIALVETSTSTLQLIDTPPANASCTAQLTETNTPGSASASAGCALISGPIFTPLANILNNNDDNLAQIFNLNRNVFVTKQLTENYGNIHIKESSSLSAVSSFIDDASEFISNVFERLDSVITPQVYAQTSKRNSVEASITDKNHTNIKAAPITDLSGETLNKTLGTLPASEQIVVRFNVTVDFSATVTSVSNTANITAGGGININSTTATNAVFQPPAFSKAFSPNLTILNGVSKLTFTINNSAQLQSISQIAFTDNLPAGMVVADTPNAAQTCAGGTITAVAASGSISYSGGTVGANASCTVSVDVKATAEGALVNTSGNLNSFEANQGGTATATLTVTNTSTWTGSNGSNWNDLNNWNPLFVPAATNNVIIPTAGVTNEPAISASNITVSNLTIQSGRTLTVSSGRTLNVTSALINNGTLNIAGSFTFGTFTANGTVNFTGTATQNIPAVSYNNLTVNNAAGASLTGNTIINGTLTLTNGILGTGTNTLTFSTTGTSVRNGGSPATSCFIVGDADTGGVTKHFPAGATAAFTFHVGTTGGTDNGYTPVALANVTVASAGDGLTVRAVDAVSTAAISTPKISRYWQLTETGDLTTDLTFTYLSGDTVGITDPTALRIFRNSVNVCMSDCVTEASFTGTVTEITEFSPWTIVQQAPTAASVTISGRVLNQTGRGIANGQVIMIDVNGNIRYARTNPFGHYRFNDVEVGITYIINVKHKSYEFAPQVVNLNNARDDINFIALP
jgi:hypothetical protein